MYLPEPTAVLNPSSDVDWKLWDFNISSILNTAIAKHKAARYTKNFSEPKRILEQQLRYQKGRVRSGIPIIKAMYRI